MTLEQNIGFNSTEGRDIAYHLPLILTQKI